MMRHTMTMGALPGARSGGLGIDIPSGGGGMDAGGGGGGDARSPFTTPRGGALVKAAAQMMIDPTPPGKSYKRGKSVVVGGTHTMEFEADDM